MRSDRLLPSLLALRAFEAVARHGSMTRACEELLITQSAISHHIIGLEEELGVRLFVRQARGLALTDVGERYREAVNTAFSVIVSATAELRASASAPVVRASVLPSFAAHWLMPRLARFRAVHPDIALELDPTLRQAVFNDSVEVAIRYGSGNWPGLTSQLLMSELLTPVVAAGRAGDIDKLPILLTSKAFEWSLWCESAGEHFVGRPRIQLTDYNIALQAALNGEGIAMGRLRLVRAKLESGELVAPFSFRLETPSDAYWCVHPKGRGLSDAAQRWIDWIKDEVARDIVAA